MKEKTYKIFSFINEYSLYGILFFLPISKAIIESLFGLALLAFVLKNCLKPDLRFLKTAVNLTLLVVFLFFALSLFNNGKYLAKSLSALFLKWGEYFALFYLFQDAIRDRKKGELAVRVFFISSFIVVADCIFQRLVGHDFFRWKAPDILGSGAIALRAAFNNYNSLSSYLVIAISIMAGLLLRAQKAFLRTVLWIILAFACFALVLTFSRGGWLGFILACLVILSLRPKSYGLLVAFCIFGTLLFLIPEVKERFLFIFKTGGDTNRFLTWKETWGMVQQNPFLGKGIGTFMDYFPKQIPWLIIGYAHNCYLQIWFESGIFSLISFLAFITMVIFGGFKAFLRDNDFLVLGISAGLTGFLLHSFFDTQFYSLQLSFLFWSIAGILVSLTKLAHNADAA
jgi:O-antigen ligase